MAECDGGRESVYAQILIILSLARVLFAVEEGPDIGGGSDNNVQPYMQTKGSVDITAGCSQMADNHIFAAYTLYATLYHLPCGNNGAQMCVLCRIYTVKQWTGTMLTICLCPVPHATGILVEKPNHSRKKLDVGAIITLSGDKPNTGIHYETKLPQSQNHINSNWLQHTMIPVVPNHLAPCKLKVLAGYVA